MKSFLIFFFLVVSSIVFSQNEKELNKARAYYNSYELDDAQKIIEKILKKDADNWEALYLKYMIDTDMQWPNAELAKSIIRSVKINVKYPLSQSALAGYYWQIDPLELAYFHYTRSIELDPKASGVYHNRAQVNMSLGNYQECIEDVDKAFSTEDGTMFSLNGVKAMAYLKLGEIEKAKETIDYLLEKENLPENHRFLADFYFETNEYLLAAKEYKISNEPEYDGGWGNYKIAKCYLLLKDNETCCFYYNEALKVGFKEKEEMELICKSKN